MFLRFFIIFIIFSFAGHSFSEEKIENMLSGYQILNMSQDVQNVSKNYFSCNDPELLNRKITYLIEPEIRNGLTSKVGEQHEIWNVDACGKKIIFGFNVEVAPDRKDSLSLFMLHSEIKENLVKTPNLEVQENYSKLIVGRWTVDNNDENSYSSISEYDAEQNLTYSWDIENKNSGKEIQTYELIGDVLCHTVVETQNSNTPIGFKQCSRIKRINNESLVFDGLNDTEYKLRRIM